MKPLAHIVEKINQTYIGQESGAYLPADKSGEELKAPINGDDNNTVVLGSVLKSSDEPQIHFLKSASGHCLCIEDMPVSAQMVLESAQGENQCVMTSDMSLMSRTGSIHLHAEKNCEWSAESMVNIDAQEALDITAGNMHFAVNDKAHIQSAREVTIHAGESVTTEIAENVLINVNGSGKLSSSSNVVIECADTVEWKHQASGAEIGAKCIHVQTSCDITLKVGASEITMGRDGKIIFRSRSIQLKAAGMNLPVEQSDYT